jgi:hypothetical protein
MLGLALAAIGELESSQGNDSVLDVGATPVVVRINGGSKVHEYSPNAPEDA